MSFRFRATLLVCALAGVGLAVAVRFQPSVKARLFAARLESEDAPPEAAAGAARALLALDPEERTFERLGPRAKLRYLLANGFSLAEIAPRLARRAPEPGAAGRSPVLDGTDLLDRGGPEEARLGELAAGLTRSNTDLACRWLRESPDAAVRRRAAEALTLAGDVSTLSEIEARLADADPGVQVAAFVAGQSIAARAPDRAVYVSFLANAARTPGVSRRAIGAACAEPDRRMVPVYVAFLECPDTSEAEKAVIVEAIRKLLDPAEAATAPTGPDPAAWRAWWDPRNRP